MRGAFDAREAPAQLHGPGTPRAGRDGANRATSEEGKARLPIRSSAARLAQDAAITLGLQVNFDSTTERNIPIARG